MKLRSGNKKRTRLIIIIVASILVIAAAVAGILIAVNAHNEKVEQDKHDRTVIGIIVNVPPTKTVYTVGEEFDPSGIRIQVKTNLQDHTYFIEDASKMQFVGFDSSEPTEDQRITVIYDGWSAIFTVRIKEPEISTPVFVGFEVCDLPTEYSIERWNNYGADYSSTYLLLKYSDGSTSKVWLDPEWATERIWMDAPGKTTITYEYLGKSVTVEFTITE